MSSWPVLIVVRSHYFVLKHEILIHVTNWHFVCEVTNEIDHEFRTDCRCRTFRSVELVKDGQIFGDWFEDSYFLIPSIRDILLIRVAPVCVTIVSFEVSSVVLKDELLVNPPSFVHNLVDPFLKIIVPVVS